MNKKLHMVIKKGSKSEDSDVFENIIPLLNEYRKIVISMQGFRSGEVLEKIRPLTRRNILSTLIVYNGVYEDSGNDNYDEKLVIS